jgi:hypothetical protein
VALKEIGLGHKNYSLKNIHNFLQKPWNSDFSLTVEFEVFTVLFINIKVLWGMANKHGTLYSNVCNFSVIIQNKLFYKMKDNMTISYHSIFLLNSTLLFPEYSFYSTHHITFILYLSVRMSTTSHVHSMLISIFIQRSLKEQQCRTRMLLHFHDLPRQFLHTFD